MESILEQNYQNLEIILVDDGSTDGSGDICDDYAAIDDRIKVIHKDNQGVSAARNSGLDLASGEWVCYVDGDDYVMPDYVGYLLALARSHNADVALTTRMFGNYDVTQEPQDNVQEWTGEDAVEAILCYRVPIGCYCKIFRAEHLRSIRFIPDIFIGEGFNYNIAMFQEATSVVAGCMKTYYYRRDNATSAMTRFSIEKCECGLRALEVIRNNLKVNTDRIDAAWRFANWRTHSDFYDMCVLAGVQREYPQMYERCLKVTRRQAFIALKVPTTRQNKLRAIAMWIWPGAIPLAMKWRKRRYHVNVSNR